MLLLFPSTSVKQQDYIQVWLSSSWGFSAAGHLTQEVGKKKLCYASFLDFPSFTSQENTLRIIVIHKHVYTKRKYFDNFSDNLSTGGGQFFIFFIEDIHLLFGKAEHDTCHNCKKHLIRDGKFILIFFKLRCSNGWYKIILSLLWCLDWSNVNKPYYFLWVNWHESTKKN